MHRVFLRPVMKHMIHSGARAAVLALVLLGTGCHFSTAQSPVVEAVSPNPQRIMKVQIWSDVLCPFCYIGKREFENALSRFPAKDNIVVEWKSFQLDPSAPKRSPDDMYTMLAKKYGRTREQAQGMVQGVVDRAKTVGLDYNMEQAVMANSYDAHRLIQLAKTKGKGDAIEERLFRAHFMEGVDIADQAALQRLGEETGLAKADIEALWTGDAFGDAVRSDIQQAQQIGVRGVPFFVIDEKYAVSGAQASDHFLGALQQAWNERPTSALKEVPGADGPACTPEGECAPAASDGTK